MNPDLSVLIHLAEARFPGLTGGERSLLEATQLGQHAVLGSLTAPDKSPALAGQWGEGQRIRAELIRWLCTDKAALRAVDGRGILVMYGKITGKLDLSFTTIAFPLEFISCAIPDGIDLESSDLVKLRLSESLTGNIWAVVLRVQGDVFLDRGFETAGEVLLDGAEIRGSLVCTGAKFLKQERFALSLFSSKIHGSVYLNDKFCSRGEVSLRMANIGGNLHCDGGHFGFDITAPAIAASQAQIGGSVFFRFGFEAKGVVDFIAVRIGGDLDCSGAWFSNPGEVNLHADRLVLGSSAFFTNACEADGFIRLVDASIGISIEFINMKFLAGHPNGVNLSAATINRRLVWQEVARTPDTVLYLDNATAGSLNDDESSWPAAGKLSVYGFKYGNISGANTAARRRAWLRLQVEDPSLQPYEQLGAILRAKGHELEAQRVAMDREDKRYARFQTWKTAGQWIWGGVLKYTIGYGYAPGRALYGAAGIVLLGWLVFALGSQKQLFSPVAEGLYKNEDYRLHQRLPEGYQTFSPFMYSLDTFLPIIDFHQESTWQPNPDRACTLGNRLYPCGKYLRMYWWAHIVIGWAITTLAVIGFTGIIRKS